MNPLIFAGPLCFLSYFSLKFCIDKAECQYMLKNVTNMKYKTI